jgi:Ca-activated chloride channel family protein
MILSHYFDHPLLLWAALVLPALAVLAFWAWSRRRIAIDRLGPPGVIASQIERPVGRWRPAVGWTIGILLLVVGTAGPHWGLGPPPPTAPGRDVVCLVDVSHSMLAQDALPSRLGKAKDELAKLANVVETYGGHRLALVAFASRAAVVCPLTHDYDHFRAKIAALSADPPPATARAVLPTAVSGTRIGAGIQRAIDLLDPQFRGAQEIVLFSDGDDPSDDEEWRKGLDAARRAGVSVTTVGIGDPNSDRPIPLAVSRLTFHGTEVRTRLHEQPLREIAAKSGGQYVAAGTGPVNVYELFRTRIASGPTRETVTGALPQPVTRHSLFFLAAMTFVVGSTFRLNLRKALRRLGMLARPRLLAKPPPVAALLALMLVSATPPADWLRRGNDGLAAGRPDDALADFAQAARATTDPGLAAFNEGVALFRLGRFREAEWAFRRCLSDATGGRRVRALYNLGCALLQESQGRSAATLRSAARSFELGAKEVHDGDPLSDDLRHNLKLSTQMLAAIRQAHPNEPPESPDQPTDQISPMPAGRNEGGEPAQGRQDLVRATGPDGRPLPKNDGRAPNPTDKMAPPGKGNLPPLPDEDALTPLAPEGARAHLEKAAERIAAERRAALKRTAPGPATAFPDW